MDERRRAPRSPVAFHAEVRQSASGELIGHLADVSEGGMMISTERPPAVGASLRLEIELPRRLREEAPLVVEARVRWSEAELQPDLHTVGFEFVDAAAAAATIARIQRLFGETG